LAIMVCALIALVCAAGAGYLGWREASQTVSDQRIWRAGIPLGLASVNGQVTTQKLVAKTYELQVSYRLPSGELHAAPLSITTLFGGLEEGKASLRVLPNDPRSFALEAAVIAAPARFRAAAFFATSGLVAGVLFGLVAWAVTGQWRRAARAVRSGMARGCPLVDRQPVLYQGRPTGNETFRFTVDPQHSEERAVSYQLNTKRHQVLALRGGRELLAIVRPGAPNDSIVLRDDYYPLAFSEEQRGRADAAVRAAAL
jgi:hypothetical protein